MCRNIRLLHHFEPPTSVDEMDDAALQYVRKVSGVNKPRVEDQVAFERAVAEISDATRRLLAALPARGTAHTREGEREKAKRRWTMRQL
jgi:hypothetical protein